MSVKRQNNVYKKDDMQEIYKKVLEANIIAFASPVFFTHLMVQ